MSPKFLAGESYGTLRGAALAEHLQTRYGMYLNGLMLISSVLDLGSLDFEKQRNDRPYALYLPTYAAIAHYHGKHGGRSLRTVLAEAEEYAAARLPVGAVARRPADRRRSARPRSRKLASLTGLTEDYVDRADLRIEHIRFFTELLRDERRTVGRLDGRFTGPAADGDRRGDGRRPVDATRSRARTPRRSTTTSATSSATRATCPTSRSHRQACTRGRTRSSRAGRST